MTAPKHTGAAASAATIPEENEVCFRSNTVKKSNGGNSTDISSSILLRGYIEKLKQIYQDKAFTGITGLFEDESDVMSIDDYYVNLALIKEEEQKLKEKHEVLANNQMAEMLDSVEQFFTVKENIDLKNIFNIHAKQPSVNSQRILMIGRPGSGKSTLCQYIANQWSQGKLWNNYYQAVFRIPLRNLISNYYPSGQKYTLLDIIKRECFNDELSDDEQEQLKQFLQNDKKKYLLVFDGYDELSVQTEDKHLTCLVEQWLKYPAVILTSRPQVISIFDASNKLEILGFTSNNILHYIDNYFKEKPQLQESLKRQLYQQPLLFSLAHIPLNIALICRAWEREPWLTDITLTQLYQNLLQWLERRYLKKYHEDYMRPEQQADLHNLREEDVEKLCSNWLVNLEKIAWQMRNEGKIYLNKDELLREEKDIKKRQQQLKSLYNSGLLRLTTDKKSCYFTHLTLQEFLAARYLSNQDSNMIKQTIVLRASDKNYLLMLTFVAGLLVNSNDKLPEFFDYFCHTKFDQKSLYDRQANFLLLNSMNESLKSSRLETQQSLILSGLVFEYLRCILVCSQSYHYQYFFIPVVEQSLLLNRIKLMPKLLHKVGFISFCKEICESDTSHPEAKIMMNIILQALEGNFEGQFSIVKQATNVESVVTGLRILMLQWPTNISIEYAIQIIEFLIGYWRKKNVMLSKNFIDAVYPLLKFLFEKYPALISEYLISAEFLEIGYQDSTDCILTIFALHLGTNKILSNINLLAALFRKLKNENYYITQDKVVTLKKLEIIDKKFIIAANSFNLSHDDREVRQNAAEKLIELGEINDQVVRELLQESCEKLILVLNKLDKKDDYILQLLVKNLSDKASLALIKNAALVLGKLGKVNKIITESLAKNLTHASIIIRKIAQETIEQLGISQAEEVVSAYIENLSSYNAEIRQTAAEKLIKLNKTNDNIIQVLKTNLSNIDFNIKTRAVVQVCKLGIVNNSYIRELYSILIIAYIKNKEIEFRNYDNIEEQKQIIDNSFLQKATNTFPVYTTHTPYPHDVTHKSGFIGWVNNTFGEVLDPDFLSSLITILDRIFNEINVMGFIKLEKSKDIIHIIYSLQQNLFNKDLFIRQISVRALIKLDKINIQLLNILLGSISSEKTWANRYPFNALEKLIESKIIWVRKFIFEALRKKIVLKQLNEQKVEKIIEIYRKNFYHTSLEIRGEAKKALVEFEALNEQPIDFYIKYLSHKDTVIKRNAEKILTKLGRYSDGFVIETLIQAYLDIDNQIYSFEKIYTNDQLKLKNAIIIILNNLNRADLAGELENGESSSIILSSIYRRKKILLYALDLKINSFFEPRIQRPKIYLLCALDLEGYINSTPFHLALFYRGVNLLKNAKLKFLEKSNTAVTGSAASAATIPFFKTSLKEQFEQIQIKQIELEDKKDQKENEGELVPDYNYLLLTDSDSDSISASEEEIDNTSEHQYYF